MKSRSPITMSAQNVFKASLLAGLNLLMVQALPAALPREEVASKDQQLAASGELRAAANAHFLSARMLEDAGKMREALDHYLAFLKTDQGDAELVNHIAELAVNYQGLDSAVKLLEDQIKANPSSPDAQLSLINFSLTHGNEENGLLTKTAAISEQALTKFPKNAEIYIVTVRLQIALAQFEKDPAKMKAAKAKASQTLELAAKQTSTESSYWLDLGRIAQEVWPLSNPEIRAENLKKINGFFDKALTQATAEKDEDAQIQVADYFLFSNQFDRSLAVNEAVVKHSGNIDARKRVVRLYEAMDKADESLNALESLVEAYPLDIEHQKLLASVYLQKRNVDKALPHLEAALKAGGGEMQDYLQICALMRFVKEPERFENFAQRAAQLFQNEPRVLYYHAVALTRSKKYAEAAKLFERTAQLAETMAPERLDYDFHFNRGIALERSGRIDESVKEFQQSIQLTPADNPEVAANAMNYLGYMWADKGQHLDQAGELIRKANELSPNVNSFIDSLGWLYYQQGKYDEALKEFQRAEAMQETWEPEDAEMLEHLARTYEKLNNKDKALEYWKRTLDLKPTNEEVRKRAEAALGIKPEPKTEPPAKDK